MTFYLKYRPKTIFELDLQSVREQLQEILSADHFPHAFLFSGPKGLGKTSAARIVTKAINCLNNKGKRTVKGPAKGAGRRRSKVKGQFVEPCNKCEVCRTVNGGMALDMLEIDAASNRGIDDIRELREKIKLAPFSFKHKVYIIDEVHMLTTEAFNALLKTLEEPPEHAVFILATTGPQKLPETIISRCLHIKFKKATVEEIIRSLKRIIKGEKLNVNDEALALIARQAGGSFRDATKILEQLSFAGKKIRLAQVESLINQSGQFDLLKWLDFLLGRNSESCLRMLEEAVEEGVDLKWLVTQTLEKLRQLLLAEYGMADDKELSIVNCQLSIGDLVYLMELLNRAGIEAKTSIIPQLPLELAIVGWGEEKIKNEKLKMKSLLRGGRIDSSDGETKHGKLEKSASRDSSKDIKTKIEDISQNWEKVLRCIRPHNHSVEALLRSSRPLRLESGTLVIEAFYQFHKERLEVEKCRALVEKVLGDVFGERFKVRYLLGERKTTGRKKLVKKEEELVKTAEEIFMNNS